MFPSKRAFIIGALCLAMALLAVSASTINQDGEVVAATAGSATSYASPSPFDKAILTVSQPTPAELARRADKALDVEQAFQRKKVAAAAELQRVADYLRELQRQEEERQAAAAAKRAAERKAATERRATAPASQPSGGGGALPDILWRIARCEGYPGYVYKDHGHSTSTASGKFGFLDSTWRSWRPPEAAQYARAFHAPEHLQDQAAIRLYNASGTTPWNASRHCWS